MKIQARAGEFRGWRKVYAAQSDDLSSTFDLLGVRREPTPASCLLVSMCVPCCTHIHTQHGCTYVRTHSCIHKDMCMHTNVKLKATKVEINVVSHL